MVARPGNNLGIVAHSAKGWQRLRRTLSAAMAVTMLDGRAFSKFVAAGTYFLRKYRGVLNDLNVFPVPDGDTGSNMYLTSMAAARAAARVKNQPLCAVAEAAAHASLLGARGNSGVIFSQMFRGFARTVQDRDSVDPADLARALQAAVETARAALQRPVEGTILSVADAAASAGRRAGASTEPDLDAFADAILQAASEALERTPDQLPILKEAGVVDSGGAGFVYFLEGIVRFRSGAHGRESSRFVHETGRKRAFTAGQTVGRNRFCTEFVLEDVHGDPEMLRAELASAGDSLIVAGAPPQIKVHLHTGDPEAAQLIGAGYGTVTRLKVEDMAKQHRALVVEGARRAAAAVAVMPGEGFADVARDLAAEALLVSSGANPSVQQLLEGVRAANADTVYLLCGDGNVVLAAREAAALSEERVVVVPTRDAASNVAALIALGSAPAADLDAEAILGRIAGVATASLFYAAKACKIGDAAVAAGQPAATVGGTLVTAPTLPELATTVAGALGASEGGLITLYYGGTQDERDAQRTAAVLGERFADVTIEVVPGGAPQLEYVIAVER